MCAMAGFALSRASASKIPHGSIHCYSLIGANGAGKSSIIRSIAGLNKRVSGRLSFRRRENDAPISLMGLKPEDMVRRGISRAFAGRPAHPATHLTVEENLQLGAYSRDDKDGIASDIEWVYSLFPRLQGKKLAKGRHAFRRRTAKCWRSAAP